MKIRDADNDSSAGTEDERSADRTFTDDVAKTHTHPMPRIPASAAFDLALNCSFHTSRNGSRPSTRSQMVAVTL